MEVIGAGWGRTGTLSLKTALEELGLPCYHMQEVFKRPSDAQLWLKAAGGDKHALDTLLGGSGFKASVDWPAASLWRQQLELYPRAKVVLSVRSPDAWLASFRATIWRASRALYCAPWYVRAVMDVLSPTHDRSFRLMTEATVWTDLKGVDVDAEPECVQQLFLEHIEAVKRAVPAEQLLVFNPRDGWGPLCAFLGKPAPDTPFPHVNDTAEFEAMFQGLTRTTQALTWGMPALGAAAVAGAALLLSRRRA